MSGWASYGTAIPVISPVDSRGDWNAQHAQHALSLKRVYAAWCATLVRPAISAARGGRRCVAWSTRNMHVPMRCTTCCTYAGASTHSSCTCDACAHASQEAQGDRALDDDNRTTGGRTGRLSHRSPEAMARLSHRSPEAMARFSHRSPEAMARLSHRPPLSHGGGGSGSQS